jgi:hypothetical protein
MHRHTLIASITLALAISLAAKAETSLAPAKLSAAEIVDKNVSARGGLQAWRAVQALSMTGKMDAGGNERATLPMPGRRSGPQMPPPRPTEQVQLPFLLELKRPNKMRVELQFQGQTALQVFDGTNGWKLRPFLGRKDVEPFTPEEMKGTLLDADLDGPLVDYAAKGIKVELEGVEKVEGRDAYKLKLTMTSDRVRHVWIDAETFLDVKVEGVPRRMDGRMHPVEIYLRDYKSVNGLLLPYVVETSVQGFRPTHKMAIETVTVNPKLEDALFSKPNPTGK